jgi:hypothetical protein
MRKYLASWQQAVARARELIATSILAERVDPELSVLIAAQAVAATWSSAHAVLPESEQQLHHAIMESDRAKMAEIMRRRGLTPAPPPPQA